MESHTLGENWSSDSSDHWKLCTKDNCTVLVDKADHTSIDDNDCTTAIKCSVCNETLTEAKEHIIDTNWSSSNSQHWKECTNNVCTTILEEKTNHTMQNGSNVCKYCNIIDVSIFTITNGNLSACNPGTYTFITIPDSVTSIGDWAFWGCSSLVSIDIPDSVTSIGNYAFSGCSGIESITVAEGNERYHSKGNSIIETLSKTLIVGCKNSVIPTDGSVTHIGDLAFDGCSSLVSIIIPDSVTHIGNSAFAWCSGLVSINIPDSVTHIDDYAFAWCTGLESITYNGTTEQWNAITKGHNWNYSTGNYTVTCSDGTLDKN